MVELDETVKEFLVESLENLDHFDQELLVLEVDPRNANVINHIFRIVHTIKGTCGFFEFHNLEAVSHVGENLLDSLRDGSIFVSAETVTALLNLGDALRTMIVNIEQHGTEGSETYETLRQRLTDLNEPQAQEQDHDMPATPEDAEKIIRLEEIYTDAEPATEEEELPTQQRAAAQEAPEQSLEELFVSMKQEYDAAKAAPEVTAPAKSASPPAEEAKKSDITETALRVDVGLLDKLMNLVGELVLARNQILQFTKKQNDSDFINTSQRLNLITSELQEGVMRTRMQPIANVWNKLPRIVRDVAHSCGKEVALEMQGKETELDKTIIEAIKDPLTHIIRNSVDHGIENPDARAKAGKRREGSLLMKAYHEGGQVIIEISDDGAGLDAEKIRRKAVERGIVPAEKAPRLTEQEVQRLIFLPGFSTAEKITNISGRGVGMDVVRSNIERIGGTVDVSSKFGFGTSFIIKIPLTLAIIPALVVAANGNRYAIPQVNLLELVRIDGEQITKNLEEIHGATFYRLRGKLLPLLRLREVLGLEKPGASRTETVLSMVVVRADNHQFGLLVDAIHDTEEIVVKPLGKLLKGVSAFAGATIMGDGRVALILDVAGLGRKAQITKEEAAAEQAHAADTDNQQDKRKMLIFDVANDHRAAIPLDQVHRLEEFDAAHLERAAGQMVVQYRGGILPLIDLQEALSGEKPKYNGSIRAFVHEDGGHYVGFVVQRIVDIVEQTVNVQTPYKRKGLIGSAIIQGSVTDLVDLTAVIERAQGQ